MPGVTRINVYVDKFNVPSILLKNSSFSEECEQPELIPVVRTVFPLPRFLAIWHVSLT